MTTPQRDFQPTFVPDTPAPRRRRNSGVGIAGLLIDHGLPLLASVLLIARGTGYFGARADLYSIPLQAVGYGGLVLVLALAPILVKLRQQVRGDGRLRREFESLSAAMRRLADQEVLSDDARRLLNRRAERELLCRAIEEDISSEEWDAALVLCTELADNFGYRAEAEQFRSQIEKARSVVHERRVADAIASLDGLIVQRRWEAAVLESARIKRLFPDSPRVEGLRERVERARAVYKSDLERRFLGAAADAERAEEALDLLRELDGYLTETEAAPYREVARGVIGKARDNLGAQFKIAVQDRQWIAAAALGRRIIGEFPNTRMALEIREHLDSIVAKANNSPEQ
ncbi:MAG: hypothetical protein KF745_04285 [Phycisphaeraceae bacterium]|nr:hypothetical protein [Phycisphaeraceae bacterium]